MECTGDLADRIADTDGKHQAVASACAVPTPRNIVLTVTVGSNTGAELISRTTSFGLLTSTFNTNTCHIGDLLWSMGFDSATDGKIIGLFPNTCLHELRGICCSVSKQTTGWYTCG